jgi:hypothetical protein
MKCYDCHTAGRKADATGICHHCSVGLCIDHGTVVVDPILVHEPVMKTVALPKKARELLCRTCLEALRQRQALVEERPEPTRIQEEVMR